MASSASDTDSDEVQLSSRHRHTTCVRPRSTSSRSVNHHRASTSTHTSTQQTARLLSLEVGSLKAELTRERQKHDAALQRAKAAEAAHADAGQRISELQYTAKRLQRDVERAQEAATASSKQAATLRQSLATADSDLATRVALGHVQVVQMQEAAAALQARLTSCCSFSMSTLHTHCRANCSQPVGALLTQLRAALAQLQDTLGGKPGRLQVSPAQQGLQVQLQDTQLQFRAALHAKPFTAQRHQQPQPLPQQQPELGRQWDVTSSPPAAHSPQQCQLREPDGTQPPPSTAPACPDLSALQLQQADTASQLAVAQAELAAVKATLARRAAADGQQVQDAAATLGALAGKLALAHNMHRGGATTPAGVAVWAGRVQHTAPAHPAAAHAASSPTAGAAAAGAHSRCLSFGVHAVHASRHNSPTAAASVRADTLLRGMGAAAAAVAASPSNNAPTALHGLRSCVQGAAVRAAGSNSSSRQHSPARAPAHDTTLLGVAAASAANRRAQIIISSSSPARPGSAGGLLAATAGLLGGAAGDSAWGGSGGRHAPSAPATIKPPAAAAAAAAADRARPGVSSPVGGRSVAAPYHRLVAEADAVLAGLARRRATALRPSSAGAPAVTGHSPVFNRDMRA